MDPNPPSRKLLDQLRDALRVKHYALSTEKSYADWARRFTLRVFHHKRHPETLGEKDMAASRSVTHLAISRKRVSATNKSRRLSGSAQS